MYAVQVHRSGECDFQSFGRNTQRKLLAALVFVITRAQAHLHDAFGDGSVIRKDGVMHDMVSHAFPLCQQGAIDRICNMAVT
jgi:hypothetical protein